MTFATLFWLSLSSCLSCAAGACLPGSKPMVLPPGVTEGRQVIYDDLFAVTYYSTYKVVRYNDGVGQYKGAWPNAGQRGGRLPDLVLYQCDTHRPTASSSGVAADAQFFEIPLRSSALPWTGALHFFELLAVTKTISHIDMSYVTSPCAQLLEACTPGVHESAHSATWPSHTADAQAVFTDAKGLGFSNSSRDVVFDVTSEASVVRRAEWLRFLALFFNEEARAAEVITRIKSDYDGLRAKVGHFLLDLDPSKQRARVAWVSSFKQTCHGGFACPAPGLFNAGNWQEDGSSWCSCGGYTISTAHYKKQLVRDAGGELITLPAEVQPGCSFATAEDGSSTYACLPSASEHFRQLLGQADVLVDETAMPDHGAYGLADFMSNFDIPSGTSLKAMSREAIFRTDKSVSDPHDTPGATVGTSWFEQMLAQPQQILSEMMTAVWGKEFQSRCSLRYLRRLYGYTVQNVLEEAECPFHDDSDGNHHDCEGVHNFEHQVPVCGSIPAPPPPPPSTTASTTSTQGLASESEEDEKNIALELGIGLGVGVLIVTLLTTCACWRYRKGRSSEAVFLSTGNTVIGQSHVEPAV